MKKNISPEVLCSGFPEMIDYMSYARKLEFEEEPDYNFLRKLLSNMLKRIHNSNDLLFFSWIKSIDLQHLKNPVNLAIRKESPQNRIYQNIRLSLEKRKNLSYFNDSGNDLHQQVCSEANLFRKNNIDKNIEIEQEQKSEQKKNKNLIKSNELLNTTIANLDFTVDENIDEYENKALKVESKDDKNNNSVRKFNINHNNNNFDLIIIKFIIIK